MKGPTWGYDTYKLRETTGGEFRVYNIELL